jgi:acyl carrier protein
MNGDTLLTAVREAVAALLSTPLSPQHDGEALADLAPEYDSLGVLDCVGAIEERFGVSVDLVDDDLRVTFRSVASIAALVERKLSDAAILGAEL